MFKGLKKCSAYLLRQQLYLHTNRNPSPAQALAKQQRNDKFVPSSTYEGFICKQAKNIPEFNMTAYVFEHERLKSQFLHLDRNDSNNVFGICFRTTPYDSTGLPHILEHITLCGSERYPVRDPFFKMINRSVATFMNAFTGPDFTMYPFSSMNETDFRNLQKIYLDAVFKPNLKYLDFLQEGWRLEHKTLDDPQSEYLIKGVVYNEMKGAFSENSAYFSTKLLNKILPDNTYQHCSGGDPLAIPMLTHKNLVDFHQKYYHPSNARFFSYGNFDILPTLSYVNTEYLNNFKHIDNSFSQIPLQTRWNEPRKENVECRYDTVGAPIEKQHQIAIGYLMSDVQNANETILLNVLTELLVKGPNSKFYKNLIEPKISGGYSPSTGFDASLRDTMFVVGLQDVEKQDFDKILSIFDQTIDEVIQNGFDSEHVESVLNNIELGLKHQSPKFGLSIMFNVLPVWLHDGDVISSLQFSDAINAIRENLKRNPSYLKEKVKHYFKDNKHRLEITSSPDVKFEQKSSVAEQKLIDSLASSLGDDSKQKLHLDTVELSKTQKKQDDSSILPCLSLADVVKPPEPYAIEETHIHNIPTQICTIDTNNVTYINGLYNASGLKTEQKMLLPLLVEIVDQMGTKNLDYRAFDKQVNLCTSGIRFGVNFATGVDDLSKYQVGLRFSSYCLDENTSKMFDLIHELIANFKFDDVQRFEMLLQNYQSALTVGIAQSGHIYAMQSAAGLVTEAQQLKARINGIEHIEFIRNLMKEHTPAEILKQLKEVASLLFTRASFKAALNMSKSSQCIDDYSNFIKRTTSQHQSSPSKWDQSHTLPQSNVHSVMNIPVNYCAKSIQAVPYDHVDFAPLRILGKVLSSKYLLPVVREQNGAYGAGAKIDEQGLFSFFSYRDPNTTKTLQTFDDSAKWVNENGKVINDQTMFEAKLGVLQTIDAPVGPGDKGLSQFRIGLSQDRFFEQRKRVLNVKYDDLCRVVDTYLRDEKRPHGRFVLGPENEGLKDNWNTKKL